MKTLKKFLAALGSAVMCCGAFALSAGAATVTQDGLEVQLVSDKESYSATESITATLTVKNTNASEVDGLTLENLIPAGYTAIGANKQTAVKLEPDKQVTLKTVFSPAVQATPVATVSGAKTGDSGAEVVGITFAVLIGASALAVLAACKRKRGTKMLSILCCAAIAGVMGLNYSIKADAAGTESNSITITETVSVGGKELTLKAEVCFGNQSNDDESAEDYYKRTSEIFEEIDVKTSPDVMTEAEVIAFLEDRGFEDVLVTYDYTIDGEYCGETEADSESDVKHPMYQAFYSGEDSEDEWIIYVLGKCIVANPFTYNMKAKNLKAQVLIAESDKILSYDDEKGKYYLNTPKETSATLKTVEAINAETLDKLTAEEIEKL